MEKSELQRRADAVMAKVKNEINNPMTSPERRDLLESIVVLDGFMRSIISEHS